MKTRIYTKRIYAVIFAVIVILNSGCTEQIVPPVHTIIPGDSAWVYLGLKGESIQSIAVDPTNPEIIYAGSLYNFSESTPGCFFKSTDGGKTWVTLITDYNAQFMDIIIDPKVHNTIYTATWGIIKSYDGGKTWQDVSNGIRTDWETHVQALAIDPNNTNILYAGTAGFHGGWLYKTTDAGANWTALEGDSLADGIVSILLGTTNSNTVYIGTESVGLFGKSVDAGIHWQWPGFSEKGIIETIVMDPNMENRILVGISSGFVGTPSIWISDDGGKLFQSFAQGISDSVTNCFSLIFNSAIQFDIYEGCNNGVYRRADRNSSWIMWNQGFPNKRFVKALALGSDYNLYAGLGCYDSLYTGGIYCRMVDH